MDSDRIYLPDIAIRIHSVVPKAVVDHYFPSILFEAL